VTRDEWEATYGRLKDEVFRLSLNVQVRRGDPVRERRWDQVRADRERMGLTDREIAERLGVAVEVARATRLRAEKEHAQPEVRRLLYEIGNKPLRDRRDELGQGTTAAAEGREG